MGGGINFKHGLSNSKLYTVWTNMNKRCSFKGQHNYYLYGGRGIRVTDEWSKVEVFYEWAINNGYEEGLSLDRINNNLNYEPSNCRWVEKSEQCSNKRSNLNFEIQGEIKNLTAWCRLYGVDFNTTKKRLNSGLSILYALTLPSFRGKSIKI